MKKGRILFVDDQEDFLNLIKIKLKSDDFNLFFCTNVKDALKSIDQNDLDVIVSDMNMPEMGGVDFFEKIKIEHPEITRIALSGLSHSVNLIDAINRGQIFKYLTKPVRINETFINTLKMGIDKSRYMKFKYHFDQEDFVSKEKLLDIMSALGYNSVITENNQINEDKKYRLNKILFSGEINEEKIILFSLVSTLSFGKQIFFNHITDVDYYHGKTDAYTLTLGKGKTTFYHYPKDFEGVFTYDIKEGFHNDKDNYAYRSLGGRYQYNGIKNVTLGVKGSLDFDNFYEEYDHFSSRYHSDDYIRPNASIRTEKSFGTKFYGNIYYKPKFLKGVTTGIWNEFVFGKEEAGDRIVIDNNGKPILLRKDPNIFNNESLTLKVTPRIIYEYKANPIKFVGEAYMENGYFVNRLVEGKEHYYKYVIAPQLIIDKKTENYSLFTYTNAEYEKFQYSKFWQQTYKLTPHFKYFFHKLTFGLKGAGFEFDDEIGMNYDNFELLGYKRGHNYENRIFAGKSYLEYDLPKNFKVGLEYIYRDGKWQNSTEKQYLIENCKVFYIDYKYKISDTINLKLRNAFEKYSHSTNINEIKKMAILNEDVYRINLSFNVNI